MIHSAEDMNQMLAHPVTKLHSDNTHLNIQHPEILEYHYNKSISHTLTHHFIISWTSNERVNKFPTFLKMHKSSEVAKVYYPNI